MSLLHIDFETYSAVDLRKANAYVYFEHESTDIWCAAYSFGNEEPQLWLPGQPCPAEIKAHILRGGLIAAWNAQFERLAWREILGPRYGWPVPRLTQYRCVMAQAYAVGTPGKLEHSALELGLEERKDMDGARVMQQLAKPRRPRKGEDPNGVYFWTPEEAPDKHQKLRDYCLTDVKVEVACFNRLPALREQEQQLWFLDQRMNDAGVFIDKKLCEAALKIVRKSTERLDAEMRKVTDMGVRGVSNAAELIGFVKKRGIDASSVAKDKIVDMLIRDDLPDDVRRALEIRQEGAKTSTAKIVAMLDRRQADGRMRGNLQYHGAGTGRWAARGAQLQNLPRPSLKGDLSAVIDDIFEGDADLIEMLHGPAMSVVSDCIRSMIAAPKGKKIVAGDFSSIEARVNAWLAGESAKLAAFRAYDRKEGPDLYIVAAAGIYNVSAKEIGKDDPRRQVGKVSELALGYQGGPGAFRAMAKTYNLKIEDAYEPVVASASAGNIDAAEDAWASRGKASGMSERAWLTAEIIKLAWRQANPNIVQFWRDAEDAAIAAVENPGDTVSVGSHIKYKKAGAWLFCRLPSGRAIAYAYPKVVDKPVPWGGTKPSLIYYGVDSFSKKWAKQDFYGGLAVENIVQAVARDVMAEAMLRVERAGYPVILTVHDEIVAEPDKEFGSTKEFCELMTVLPPWAAGLPIAAEGWEGPRYRK